MIEAAKMTLKGKVEALEEEAVEMKESNRAALPEVAPENPLEKIGPKDAVFETKES